MMSNNELQMLRKALFLDIVEAAELVGGVSTRTWQRWEKGDINVSFDVEQKTRKLNHIHNVNYAPGNCSLYKLYSDHE